jgi:hypothetical protein
LLGLVTSDGADDAVLLTFDAVDGALGVSLGLGSLDLSPAGSMLLLSGVGPQRSARGVANLIGDDISALESDREESNTNSLDYGALDGMVLAGGSVGFVIRHYEWFYWLVD